MPEIKPINATTHFKCAFDIELNGASDDSLISLLRKSIRSWCKIKLGYDEKDCLYEPWFFFGNTPKAPLIVTRDGIQVRTATVSSEGQTEPEAWALELIHRDSSETARRWSVEIGLKSESDNRIRFTTVVSHWMIPNFIGEYPDPPMRSVPKYVVDILKNPNLTCKRGGSEILHQFETVTHENAQSLYEQLKATDRQLPFVFVAAKPDSDMLAIDPVAAYRSLLGSANVYAFFETSVLEEMNYYLGNNFSCEPGSVRCFLPRFDKHRDDNARIHRFFTASHIADKGQDHVLDCIANGFARNGTAFRTHDIRSFSDLFVLRRKRRLEQMFANKNSGDSVDSEELAFLKEACEALDAENQELNTFKSQLEIEKDDLQTELSNKNYLVSEAEKLRSQFKDFEQVKNAVGNLSNLPQSLEEVVRLAGVLFPQRLAIASEAFKSASDHEKGYDFWKKQEGLNIAWQMLFDLAQHGHPLLLNDQGGDIERDFNNLSRFELAMTEGKTTKANSKLMEKREFTFEGNRYSMAPHLKYGNKNPKMLRLHFAVDNQNKRLVVAHCGDHMTNASTRKKS